MPVIAKPTYFLETRDDIINVLKGGKMATVTFLKDDGTIRTLNGQFRNKSRLKGGTKPFSDSRKGIVSMCEFGAFAGSNGEFRSFRVDRLIRVKANGETFNGRMWHKLL